MNQFFVVSIFLAIVLFLGFSNLSFGQGVQTLGGVDVDGTWYLGENLKAGDYFEYSLCELDLNDCAPITLKLWIKGEITNVSETLWDAKVVIIDGNKIIKGSMGLGKSAPEPIIFDDEIHDYALAFKTSLAWLSAFTSANEDDRIHGPKEFREHAWGKIGAIGGAQLIPLRSEQIVTPAGTMNTVVVGWYSGNNNEIWVVDDFPFPVKAITYVWITTGIAPVMHQYTLLDYKENVVDDPFKDFDSTILEEELLGCSPDFFDYTSGRVSTDTFSMVIHYNYSPSTPIEGCNIDWKINFKNKYYDREFIDQIHYDIWVVDEDGNRLRSYAEDLGRDDLFNGLGQVHLLLPIKEKAGIVRYAIFIHGTGPEGETPDSEMQGRTIIEIEIAENPLLKELNDDKMSSSEIPAWIKNNAGWWADGQITDDDFVKGIQFLIKEKILNVPDTIPGTSTDSNEIPAWIKNNAGWWADGQITDDDFVKGIQYLVEQGIILV
jgi:hypothetical protein